MHPGSPVSDTPETMNSNPGTMDHFGHHRKQMCSNSGSNWQNILDNYQPTLQRIPHHPITCVTAMESESLEVSVNNVCDSSRNSSIFSDMAMETEPLKVDNYCPI